MLDPWLWWKHTQKKKTCVGPPSSEVYRMHRRRPSYYARDTAGQKNFGALALSTSAIINPLLKDHQCFLINHRDNTTKDERLFEIIRMDEYSITLICERETWKPSLLGSCWLARVKLDLTKYSMDWYLKGKLNTHVRVQTFKDID